MLSKNKSDSCRIPFRFTLLATTASNVFGLSLQPNSNLSPRLLIEADAWALYRVLDLKIRLHPRNAVTSDQVVAYIGGNQDTPPSNLAQASELLNAEVLGADETVPSAWCHPSKAELAGMLPWYKTVAGTADTNEEAPGSIYITSTTAADNFLLEIRGVYEFKTSVSTGNTPAAIQLRNRLREDAKVRLAQKEKERIMAVLGTAALHPSTK